MQLLRGGPRSEPVSVTTAVGFLHQILGPRLKLDENTLRSRLTVADEIIDELQKDVDQLAKQDEAAKKRNS